MMTADGYEDQRSKTSGHSARREEVRCHCGSLLARLLSWGIELKCRRCKRRLALPVSKEQGPEVEKRAALYAV